MTAIVLSQAEVRRLLPMTECVELMDEVLRTLARGQATNPLRTGMLLPDGKSLLGMMPGHVQEPPGLGLKAIAVFPGNHGTQYDSHQGVVLLFDTENGVPIAILDGSEVTAIRTAAVSAVATRALAREDAGDLAILGSGVQARTHLEAMGTVRELRRVRVFSRSAANRQAFAERESARHALAVEAVGSAREAVEGADLICTTTSSSEPVLQGEWIAPGTHVNAVGSSARSARELDGSAMAKCRLFVDRRESTLNESGDYLMALEEGAIEEDHIQGELGDVLLGDLAGRGSAEEVTLYKSLGLAVQDVASAHYVHARALEQGVGTAVELGGLAG